MSAIANIDRRNLSIFLRTYYVLALYDVAPTCGATAYPCATMNQSEPFDGFVAGIFLLYILCHAVQEI